MTDIVTGTQQMFRLAAGQALRVTAGTSDAGFAQVFSRSNDTSPLRSKPVLCGSVVQFGPYPTQLAVQVVATLGKLAVQMGNLVQRDPGLFTAPGLVIGSTSKAKVKNAAFKLFSSNAQLAVSSSETAFTATTHDIADPDANGREAIYVLSIAPATSAITITKGSDAALGAAVAPATPANEIKLGEVKVAHNGSAIFDASTDLLDAAHLTVTYRDAAPDDTTVTEALEIA